MDDFAAPSQRRSGDGADAADRHAPRHDAGAGAGADEPRATRHEALGDHLVWHQELICPGEQCRGRIRRFPPGVLIDDGRRERRPCPVCGTSVVAPAFYLDPSARRPRPRLPTDTGQDHPPPRKTDD